MAERDSNKINLPTNTTDIRMLACYLQAIAKCGTVSSSEEQSLFAEVKINESRKNGLFKDDGDGSQLTSAPARDTHTKSTLKLFGLIDVDGDSFSVSKLGSELISYYENQSKFSEDDRVALMLKIFLSWNLVDERYGRDIHPGLIIVKLLCDPELNYFITNHEVTVFTRNSAYLNDEQYDEIKAEILNFRNSDVPVSLDCKKNKTDIFMATFVNNWSFLMKFTENKTLNKKQKDLLLKTAPADYSALNENSEEVNGDPDEQEFNVSRYCLTVPAACVAYAHFFGNKTSHTISISSAGDEGLLYIQKMFFGAPGTGKSHKIDYDLFKDVNGNPFGIGLKSVPQDQKFRTTFHPDYDYAQFVGSYKPAKLKDNAGNPILVNNVPQLSYFFIPQVFAKAYVEAWTRILNNDIPEKEKPVYLVIEEINRGNCAQIFGDIFQLLDRKDGHSEYPIDVDSDFATYIRDELGNKFTDYKKAVCSYCDDVVAAANIADEKFCKIALPPNFNIIATMNTSDQSLFPMDSAFKRRFDWEYVPIKYQKDATCSESWNADQYVIDIGGAKYSWVGFLNAVNKDIAKVTFSEDKQMGEFFVKSNKKDSEGKYTVIDLDMFRSKVLFYLWDSVYKEEVGQTKVFHFPKGNDSEDKVTFQTFFEGAKDNQIALIKKIFSNLDLIEIPNTQTTPAPVVEDAPTADPAAPEPAEAQEV